MSAQLSAGVVHGSVIMSTALAGKAQSSMPARANTPRPNRLGGRP